MSLRIDEFEDKRCSQMTCCLSEIGCSPCDHSSVAIATRSKSSCCMWSVLRRLLLQKNIGRRKTVKRPTTYEWYECT